MLEEHRSLLQLKEKGPWAENDNNIWLCSILRLKRNLSKFNFPSRLSLDYRKQIVSFISKAVYNLPLKNLNLLRSEDAKAWEKEFLYEHFLSLQTFQLAQGGEAFITDESGLLILINIEEHLQMQLFDLHEDLENSWNRLISYETKLAETLGFSFSPKFGFLTTRAAHCGTGMQAAALLQLTALIHQGKLEEVLQRNSDSSIDVTGLHGDPKQWRGNIIQLQNRLTLGVNEETVISSLRSMATKLLIVEKGLRSRIKEEDDPFFKDKVYRAYGLLKHSLQLEAAETLDALSLLKLGVDIGWVQGIDYKLLNCLFFNSRRAHLLLNDERQEVAQKRASFIKEHLVNATLS